MIAEPFDPVAIAVYPDKQAWERVAGDLLHEILVRWRLTLVGTHEGGRAGIVVEVVQESGERAVLKMGVPHHEGRWEALALEAFPPGTAPRLLRQDTATWALLLEKILPGTPLRDSHLPVERALTAAGRLHKRIASGSAPPGAPLPRVQDYAQAAARRMRDSIREYESTLTLLDIDPGPLEHAAAELERLAPISRAGALVHGDFNPGNIVYSAAHDEWVAIDPKGMIGDPTYDLWPLVTQLGDPFASPDPVATLRDRLLIVAEAAGCDPRRTAEWGFARAGDTTLMFVEDGDHDLAVTEAMVQKAWGRVAASLA